MSRSRLPILLFCGLFLWACDGTLLNISLPGEAETVVEEGTVVENLVGEMGFGEFIAMDLTSRSEIRNQGVADGDITTATLTLFELEATDPDGADLSFLQSLELWVESPGLDRVLVAWADEFPEGEALVEFNLEDVDLTPYVISESLTLETEVEGRRPDEDTTVTARYEVVVGVSNQGACAFLEGENQ